MPDTIEQELGKNSPEIDTLYKQARLGQITIEVFFEELEKLGITDFSQAIHVANAYGISLVDAKKAYIERQPGGMDAWEAQFEGIDLESLPDKFA